MFTKKVVLSKTFTSEEEYNHFFEVYNKQGTVAWENIWNLEVGAKEAAVELTVSQSTAEAVSVGEPPAEASATEVQKAA